MSALLIDIGNSRIKWAYAQGAIVAEGAAEHQGSLPKAAIDAWVSNQPPCEIVVSNVARQTLATQLTDWTKANWGKQPIYAAVEQGQFGLTLAYEQPKAFGVDRWLAMIAAMQLQAGALCVIDCGTALTLDVVDASGHHLGGIITPGLGLMQQSLLSNTAGIENSLSLSSDPLGVTTQAAIQHGALNAVCGAIERIVNKIKATENVPITCIVTGGDANTVAAELSGDYRLEPHLVFLGLKRVLDKRT